jgi:hypothetical protein
LFNLIFSIIVIWGFRGLLGERIHSQMYHFS